MVQIKHNPSPTPPPFPSPHNKQRDNAASSEAAQLYYEPTPTQAGAQIEPKQHINQSYQDYQREHYAWRTGVDKKDVSVQDVPKDEAEQPRPSVGSVFLDIGLSLLTGGPGGMVKPRVTPRVIPRLRQPGGLQNGSSTPSPKAPISNPAATAPLPALKPSTVKLEPIKIPKNPTPEAFQEIATRSQTVTNEGEPKGYVLKGIVFRGDMRDPLKLFEQGFELRTPVKDIAEVNGSRGGFGGGRDALDPDGKGISTSGYYKQAGAGAYYYGGDKGGHTFVIDGRQLEGYHLYANNAAGQNRNGGTDFLRPWEINYGDNIPGSKIVGAFDKDGKFIPNQNYGKE